VLVEAEPCGVELFRHDGPINYSNARNVVEEGVECGAETIHSLELVRLLRELVSSHATPQSCSSISRQAEDSK
jgi:hypothetical protein